MTDLSLFMTFSVFIPIEGVVGKWLVGIIDISVGT